MSILHNKHMGRRGFYNYPFHGGTVDTDVHISEVMAIIGSMD